MDIMTLPHLWRSKGSAGKREGLPEGDAGTSPEWPKKPIVFRGKRMSLLIRSVTQMHERGSAGRDRSFFDGVKKEENNDQDGKNTKDAVRPCVL